MPLPCISQVTGRGVFVPGDDIDTDRIIPARFMKCVTFDGLGEYLFYDVRFTAEGEKKAHPLNEPRFAEASILLTGSNFGSGSSREHAPQALYRAGFRAVIAESFAEIFFGNSTQLGMPCVTLSGEDIRAIAKLIEADPAAPLTVDLDKCVVRVADTDYPCEIRDGNRRALINGRWDPLEDLLEGTDAVAERVQKLAYV